MNNAAFEFVTADVRGLSGIALDYLLLPGKSQMSPEEVRLALEDNRFTSRWDLTGREMERQEISVVKRRNRWYARKTTFSGDLIATCPGDSVKEAVARLILVLGGPTSREVPREYLEAPDV